MTFAAMMARPTMCPPAESTLDLLRRYQAGDAAALEQLCDRLVPPLRRWARGRLPRWARQALDTDDLVQETLIQTVRHLGTFQPRGDGALQAYLRQALQNRIRNEVRNVRRHPAASLDSQAADLRPSPLEETVGTEALARYEAALERLEPAEREAVVLRVELGCDYAQIAEALGKPSPDAARMTVSRALVRLARWMNDAAR
ncbi:MAG TPA: sigma-70 family RNA polymerase sigma factor [Candidatus Polarisedimenticolaceae bacterium]|nr:sigma-70 family RNA polymerase sigma factor [Candidatus Polarisedimenticolaceae bacterium]